VAKIPKKYNIKKIASGLDHTVMITQEGEILVVGNALHGKLGIPGISYTVSKGFKQIPYFQDKKVTDITCAEMHTMCIVDNTVYAWGGTLHKKLGGKDN